MERYTVFLAWKNQFCQNDCTIQAVYKFIVIPIKLPMAFFTDLKQKIVKCLWKRRRLPIAKAILRKNNSRRNQAPRFRLCYKTIVIKTAWYWHKNRNMDQWNKIESPEVDACTYGPEIYDKGGKKIQWRKDSLFRK